MLSGWSISIITSESGITVENTLTNGVTAPVVTPSIGLGWVKTGVSVNSNSQTTVATLAITGGVGSGTAIVSITAYKSANVIYAVQTWVVNWYTIYNNTQALGTACENGTMSAFAINVTTTATSLAVALTQTNSESYALTCDITITPLNQSSGQSITGVS